MNLLELLINVAWIKGNAIPYGYYNRNEFSRRLFHDGVNRNWRASKGGDNFEIW